MMTAAGGADGGADGDGEEACELPLSGTGMLPPSAAGRLSGGGRGTGGDGRGLGFMGGSGEIGGLGGSDGGLGGSDGGGGEGASYALNTIEALGAVSMVTLRAVLSEPRVALEIQLIVLFAAVVDEVMTSACTLMLPAVIVRETLSFVTPLPTNRARFVLNASCAPASKDATVWSSWKAT